MSRRDNWEPEDGMGFAGLVPTLAEKREEQDRQRAINREMKLREQVANLQSRLASAERERDWMRRNAPLAYSQYRLIADEPQRAMERPGEEG